MEAPRHVPGTSIAQITQIKSRYALVIAFSYIFIGLVVGASVAWEYARINANFESVAHERGSILFQQIARVQDWNFQHGEVYVPTTEKSPPNSARIDSNRDLQTADGKFLTLATHGSMIREIAEITQEAGSIKYHLTDLHPIHPSNRPDAWEAETLKMFEQHTLKDRLDFSNHDGIPVHRYMAPLPDKPSCIRCHEKTDSQTAGIRGGISIVMPAGSLVDIRQQQIWRMLVIHIASFIVIAGLAHLAAGRAYRHIFWLAQTSAGQQRLIDERTADLTAANTQLATEIEERKHNQAQLEESERRYRSVVESTHDGIAVVKNNHFTFVNSRLADMLGFSINEIVGTEWIDFVFEADHKIAMEMQQQKLHGDTLPDNLRMRMRHRDPSIGQITVDLQVAPMKNGEDGSNAGGQWVISVKDVTDRLRAERDQQLAAAVFESTDEAIMVTDHENRIITVNPAFTRITGYLLEETIGQTPNMLNSGRHDKAFFNDMWRTIKETGHWSGEIWNRRKDGRLYVEWLSVTAVRDIKDDHLHQNNEGCYVGTFSDITKRKEAEDLLRHKASHDILTDLPNRGLFDDRLQLAVSQAKRYQRSFALIYIDLDHFKEVNDSLGHAAGDELLTMVAQRMNDCIRESDTLSRFGGDEFAAILSDVADLDEVRDVASRIVATLAEPFKLSRGNAEISGSVGIAIYPEHGNTAEQLKDNADVALYNVKRNVRNAYRIYSAELQSE